MIFPGQIHAAHIVLLGLMCLTLSCMKASPAVRAAVEAAPSAATEPDVPPSAYGAIEPQQTIAAPSDVAQRPAFEPLPVTALHVHQVKWQRETLYSIALWYTGSGKYWKALADANPDIKPHRIRIGDTIRIPQHLIKTKRAMPADFVAAKPKVSHPPAPGDTQPVPKKEEAGLYGPILENATAAEEKGKATLSAPLEVLE